METRERARVAITGMGLVTPIGNDPDTVWKRLREGSSGIGPITRFDTAQYPTRIAGEVRNFDATDYMDRKAARNYGRYIHFALASSVQAVRSAGIDLADYPPGDAGVIVGTGIGGLEEIEEGHRQLLAGGIRRVSPFIVPMMLPNMAPAVVAMRLRAGGPNLSIISACASSANAIGEAAEIIRRGQATVMLAGGAEAAITALTMAGFCRVRAVSTRNRDPEAACRPFDRERDGFVMSEGGVMLVLEAMEHAIARGAVILAEVAGYAAGSDMYHYVAPDPSGAGVSRVLRSALADAGIGPCDVDYINAHATSTPAGDPPEVLAIKDALGDHAASVPVSSTKSVTGHLLGGAGAMGAAAAVLALVHQTLPPTINLENPDPELDLDFVPKVAREARLNVALVNSFGFGGNNATLVLRRVA
jgi:3-oxoacyl-[acyl-carrier-protein] synthase II